MAKNLIEVLSPSIIPVGLDDRFASNGNWVPVVKGRLVPGCTAVDDNPADINFADIKVDARRQPDARLRYYQEGYQLSLMVATQQVSVLENLLGMGATVYDRSTSNTNRIVGNGGSLATDPDGAEWYLVRLGDGSPLGTTFTVDALIARLKMFTDVDTTAANWKAQVYVPASTPPATFAAGTDVIDIDTKSAITDPYLGAFAFTGLDQDDVPGAALMLYDPAELYLINTTGKTRLVDYRDPDLQAGDQCCIIGLGYRHGQLANDNDYSIVQPYTRRVRVPIDLYTCLGDADNGLLWNIRRYYNCEQNSVPKASTSGSQTDPNIRKYDFLVLENDSRFNKDTKYGRYYEDDYVVFAS